MLMSRTVLLGQLKRFHKDFNHQLCQEFNSSSCRPVAIKITKRNSSIHPWIISRYNVKNNKNHKNVSSSIPKILFSTSSKDSNSIDSCAEFLSSGATRQNAHEIAKLLSLKTRREIEKVRQQTEQKSNSSEHTNENTNTNSEVTPPSKRDLHLVALNQGVPFVGFGIVDNALLIIAGEAIDETLGVMLGISTMCAAALGNIVSDLGGVALGTLIEAMCAKLGLPVPHLSTAQRSLRSVRFAGQFGTAIGLTIGCIIGMFPLLFINKEDSLQKKRVSCGKLSEKD